MSTDDQTRQYTSYSSLTTFRACPQRWNYGHVMRLAKDYPEDVPVARDLGSWWHTLMAADSAVRGTKAGSLRWAPTELSTTDGGPTIPLLGVSADVVIAAASAWFLDQPIEVKDAWTEKVGEWLPARLASMYDRWQRRWDTETRAERPLAVELRWERALPALPGPRGGEPIDPLTVLVGYVDEVYYDTKRRIVVVRDHKTANALGSQNVADDMMDSQLQFYSWGAAPTVDEWGDGPIKAVAYDRVCSVRPTTPVLTLAGSLSKSVTRFDLETYLQWVGDGVPFPGTKKDGSGAGVYQAEPEVIERLSDPAAGSAWFQRTLTPLNRNLLLVHLRSAVDSGLDIHTARLRIAGSGEAARNLTRFGCKNCDFNSLCRAQMVGGPEGDYELSDHHLKVKAERPRGV